MREEFMCKDSRKIDLKSNLFYFLFSLLASA